MSTPAYGAHAAREDRLADATAADNVRVWDGAGAGHYEVWYLTCNHLASRTGFWIRYTLEAPQPGHGDPYAQLWFACFDLADPGRTFAINRRVPIGEHRAAAQPFAVDIGAARLTHAGMRGSLRGDGHAARWDLSWLPGAETYRQLPSLVYKTGFGDTKVVTPNLDVPVRGEIEVDGRVLVFDGDPGGQTHLWGKKHAEAWAWGHCNAFAGRRGAALEALTPRVKRRGRLLPPLTVVGLRLDGEEHRFAEVRHLAVNRGRFGPGRFWFKGVGRAGELEGEFTAPPERFVLATYEDPDGEESYCANTEIADLRVTLRRRGRWGRLVEAARLEALGTAHFEIAGRAPDPGVSRRHITVD